MSTEVERITKLEANQENMRSDMLDMKTDIKETNITLNNMAKSQEKTQLIVDNFIKAQLDFNKIQDSTNRKVDDRLDEISINQARGLGLKDLLSDPTVKSCLKYIGIIIFFILMGMNIIKLDQVNNGLATYDKVQKIVEVVPNKIVETTPKEVK